MRILSWNLFGLSDRHLDERTEAAMFIALLGGRPEQVLARSNPRPPPPPEVLMFQEVTERTLHAHLRPHLRAAGYTLVPERPRQRGYFEVLAVGRSLKVVEHRITALDSGMARELVEVIAELDGERWLLLTAHLESMRYGAALRMGQAREVLEKLRGHDGPAVFGGDTNLREAEADELGVLPDAWEACGARPAERWTRVVPRTGRRARYDRVWGRGVKFRGFECIGREAVTSDGQPPSDHYGVVVTVRSTRSGAVR